MRPSAYSWAFEPLFLVLVLAAAALYVRAARHERPRAWRTISFAAGLLLVAVPVNSPLETLAAHYLLAAHLLQNALMADWAPPLLLLGLTPAMRAALADRGGAALAWLARPVVALPLWLVAWYGVHAAPFYEWALRHGWPLNLEHAILVFAGLVFWWVLFDPRRGLAVPAALVYVALAFVSSPWLSLAYIFSTHAFYGFYEHAPRMWGLSPAKDQNYGGIVMNAEQMLVFLIALATLFLRLFDEGEASTDRRKPLAA